VTNIFNRRCNLVNRCNHFETEKEKENSQKHPPSKCDRDTTASTGHRHRTAASAVEPDTNTALSIKKNSMQYPLLLPSTSCTLVARATTSLHRFHFASIVFGQLTLRHEITNGPRWCGRRVDRRFRQRRRRRQRGSVETWSALYAPPSTTSKANRPASRLAEFNTSAET